VSSSTLPSHLAVHYLVLPICLAMTLSSASADWKDSFEAKEFKSDSGTLNYRIYKPEMKEGQKFPVVLFLHGAGERGSDNTAQLQWGAEQFVSDAVQSKYPSILIFPQCPKNERWVNVDWSAKSHDQPEKPSDSLQLTFELLDKTVTELPVDTNRIYVAGLSMGGYGTWDAIGRRPDFFAAAAPICGGGDPKQAEVFKTMPIWVFHGDADNAVPVERSRKMVAALKELDGNVKYTEYPGVGHNSWSPTFKNSEFFEWLYGQTKAKK
jgi:predicted peptidase